MIFANHIQKNYLCFIASDITNMTNYPNIDILKDNDVCSGIDITGSFAKAFKSPKRVPGCLFLLCLRGECKVELHLSKYDIKKNSLAVVFPDVFFQMTECSDDCRFIFAFYSSELIHSSRLFSYTIEFTPYIFDNPVLDLNPKVGKILYDYFILMIRSSHLSTNFSNREQSSLSYTQLILGLGNLYTRKPKAKLYQSREHEIMKELIRLIINNYKKERQISFYAAKMNTSEQYLRNLVKKTTGKTPTDIISNFVIHDAKAKLRSTEMTIQEVGFSLGFSDISFFGKYFKRYTNMSPNKFRKVKD